MNGNQNKSTNLYSKKASIDFYQKRYSKGYMDEWPKDRKKRIVEVIISLDLPSSGEVLDYGCGNGVLTDVFRQTLPGWKVHGTDISSVAIANAKINYPECNFFVTGDKYFENKKFSLLLTHHVLEHVYDLDQVFEEMIGYTSTTSAMLHILPCGNEGSFEFGMCQLRKDGINREQENRFYYEDEGHLRRLDTEQMQNLCERWGFSLENEFYNNHFLGAVNNLARFGPKFILTFSDGANAIDKPAKRRLKGIRLLLGSISLFLYPLVIVERKLSRRDRSFRDNLILTCGLPFCIFAKPLDFFLKRMAYKEWRTKKIERNGSEMILFFRRSFD